MRTSKTQQIKSEKNLGRLKRRDMRFSGSYKSATVVVAFLLAFVVSVAINPTSISSATECADGVTSSGVCSTDTADVHVSVEGGWAISVSSTGTLNLDLTPTSSGTFSTVADNLNIYTNIPTGYQLYLSSTSGSTNIYNSSDAEQELNHFTATTGTKDIPVVLANNTWGYSLDNSPTTFSKVPLTSSDADSNIYSNPTKTSSSGDDIPVTYGFKADTSLTPGTYSTSVTYTAIADAPSYTIQSISPNQLALGDQTDKTFTILTTVPTDELGLGNITAKLVWNDGTTTHQAALSNCMEITQEVSGINYRGAQCSYTGNLPLGIYNIELASSWHNATYVLDKAVSIYTTMQSFTSAQCSSLAESTTTQDNRIILKDSRDQKDYYVSHLADNNCWMVQNLALDGGRTLHTTDSNVTRDRILSANVSKCGYGTTTQCTYSLAAGHLDPNGSPYGNLYNWVAATAGVGTLSSVFGTVYESVCPANWMLPNFTGEKSYTTLLNSQNITIAAQDNIAAVNSIQSPPLRFPLTGIASGGGNYEYGGVWGWYWTRQDGPYDAGHAYFMYISTDNNGRLNFSSFNKINGQAVRCVFGA